MQSDGPQAGNARGIKSLNKINSESFGVASHQSAARRVAKQSAASVLELYDGDNENRCLAGVVVEHLD